MQITIQFCTILFLFNLLSGCAPTLAPFTPHIPALTKAKDVSSMLHVSTTGAELQTAYTLTNRWTLTAHLLGDVRPLKDRKLFAAELGAGYNWQLSSETRFALYGGGGFGGGNSGFTSANLYFIDSDYNRFRSRYIQVYMQPTVSYRVSPVVLSFAVRTNAVYFTRLRERAYASPPVGYVLSQLDGQQVYYLQPFSQLNINVGQHLNFLISGGLNLPVHRPQAANISRFLVGMGLQWQLAAAQSD